MKWITNAHQNDVAKHIKELGKGKILIQGEPQGAKMCTANTLKKWGYVGIYEVEKE